MKKTDDIPKPNCNLNINDEKKCAKKGIIVGSKVKFTDFATSFYEIQENNELSVIDITDNKEGGKVALLSNKKRFSTYWLKLSNNK